MTRRKVHFDWAMAAILAVALALRLGAGAWWESRLPAGHTFGFGDSAGYWELGRKIAHGQPYEFGEERFKIFRTPGYPAVLAPLFWLRDEPPVMWGRIVSAVLSTAAVGSVAALAWILFDRRTALVAALIAAVYPEAVAMGAFVLSEAPFAPLMMLNLICWTMAWRVAGVARRATPVRGGLPLNPQLPIVVWAVAGGVAAGLATLMRPSWLLFVPFAGMIGIAFSFLRRSEPKSHKWHVIVAATRLLGLVVAMLPWWIRNYCVAGKFVPTTLQVGASLYDGLNPAATGASDMRFVPGFVAEQRANDAGAGADVSGLFEERLDHRMRDSALVWARQNPWRALQLAAIKFARMWNVLPNAAEFQSLTLRVILAATYTPVILLALAGAWRYGGKGWPYMLCILPAIYFTFLHVIFVSSIRYRQPAMLPLIVLAAGFVSSRVWNAAEGVAYSNSDS
jgi:4-amino-4-deoxy-L-arabinose transferase-like glycosyltransferase